jgi:hypothetical protein
MGRTNLPGPIRLVRIADVADPWDANACASTVWSRNIGVVRFFLIGCRYCPNQMDLSILNNLY